MKRYRRVILFISVICLTAGCSTALPSAGESADVQDYVWEALEGEVDLSYEVPESKPDILVNQLGYQPDSNKTAIFRGDDIGEVFTVRNADTGEIVYTGEVKKKGYDELYEEYDSYGVFTEVKTPGEYYVQMDSIGESYRFGIRENLYYPLLEQACLQFYESRTMQITGKEGTGEGWQMAEKGRNREITAYRSIINLLLAYEVFPEVYTDGTKIPESGNGIPDILDECRYEIDWLLEQAQTTPDENGTVCAYRAAALAKFAYLYKSVDSAYAGQCLRMAESAWKSAGKDLTVEEDLLSVAAAEMYRLTGSGQYKNVITLYLEQAVKEPGFLTKSGFYSGLTYLNTKSKVDTVLCNKVIKKMMEEAEDISEKSRQQNYMVYSEKEASDTEALLTEMLHLSIVNHIITNHEYNTVIENHFHYLLGRNPEGISYIGDVGSAHLEGTDIFSDHWQNSAFIFMVSALVND